MFWEVLNSLCSEKQKGVLTHCPSPCLCVNDSIFGVSFPLHPPILRYEFSKGVLERTPTEIFRQGKKGGQKAAWEAEILEAAKGCEQVIKSFGIFHISHGSKGLPWKDFFRNDKGVSNQKCSSSVLFLEHCRCSIQHILDSEMRWSSRFRESEAAFVCKSVLKALHYLHSRCIIHRDGLSGWRKNPTL